MDCKRPSLGAAMPFEAWPVADRGAWISALRPGDLFTDPGGGAHWRSATRSSYRGAYGRWLAFLESHGWLMAHEEPNDRMTRCRIMAYIVEAKARLKPVSVWSYVSDLNNIPLCHGA